MKLKRFVLEVISDKSYFEPNKKGKKVFRYREERKYFLVKAKNKKNAKKIERRILRGVGLKIILIDCHLYAKI